MERGELRTDVCEADAWAVMGMNVFLGLRYAIWGDDMKPAQVADAASALLRDGLEKR
jgi:hypothetical protein